MTKIIEVESKWEALSLKDKESWLKTRENEGHNT